MLQTILIAGVRVQREMNDPHVERKSPLRNGTHEHALSAEHAARRAAKKARYLRNREARRFAHKTATRRK